MKTVFVDFDGTLFDDSMSLKAASKKIMGSEMSREKIRMLPLETKKKIYDLNIRQHHNLYKPFDEVVSFVNKLKIKGADIIILTARLCEVKDIIESLVDQTGLNAKVICRPDVSVDDEEYKAEIISQTKGELWLIEDKEDNIKYIAQKIPGITTYIFKNNELKRYYLK